MEELKLEIYRFEITFGWCDFAGKHVTEEYTLPFPFLAQAFRRKKVECIVFYFMHKVLLQFIVVETCQCSREF